MVRFDEIRDLRELARAVGVPPDLIAEYTAARPQAAFYSEIRIPKKGRRRQGQFRTVYATKPQWLSEFHAAVARFVVANTAFPTCIQGFVGKRSVFTNAQQHLDSELIVHADIASFFDAIDIGKVTAAFEALGSPIASLIASACTIDGYLRQGTRCAPVIANLVCRPLDADLETLATASRARYTRYADDLSFSIPKGTLSYSAPTTQQIQRILQRHGYELRDDKVYTQRRGRAQYVTGLTVNDARPRLPRRTKKQMRLVLHYMEKHGLHGHCEHVGASQRRTLRRIQGMLSFFNAVEPALADKLWRQFDKGLAVRAPAGDQGQR